MKFKKILITGCDGFIGSHFTDECLKREISEHYVLVDAGFTGSNKAWLEHTYLRSDVTYLRGDLSKEKTYLQLETMGHGDIDAVFHIAAQSHVDRSIQDGIPFGLSNMMGTMRLLEWVKDKKIKVFYNKSTDEVMGHRLHGEEPFKPEDKKSVRNVYSASKSCQEELGFGYCHTHRVPVLTSRCSNIYGPRQYTEKFLPVIITKVLNGEKIPVYGDGKQVREWVYVKDVVEIMLGITEHFLTNLDPHSCPVFHIGSNKEYENLDFLRMIIKIMDKPSTIISFVQDRKGHDRRYYMDCSSTHSLGLVPKTQLEDGLKETIEWYKKFLEEHPEGFPNN